MHVKNKTITIYFDKERICSLPFADMYITIEPGNDYLYLEAARDKLSKKTKKAPKADASEAEKN